MNIYQKLAGVTAELSAVAKNLNVNVGKASYKAVGEADVLAAVKPLEQKYGIYSYPSSRKIVDSDVITTTSTYNGNSSEKSQFFMRLETTYRFVNVDEPKEFIDVTTYGDGVDTGDKAPGKAMTYSDKYALLKAYKIITGDDPDQNGSEEGGIRRQSEAARRRAVGKCTDCGHTIADVGSWTAERIAQSTEATYGTRLCWACATKRKREAALLAEASALDEAGGTR